MTELSANDPVVLNELKKNGIATGKVNKQVVPNVAEPAELPAPVKKKKLMVELSTDQELRLIREAANRQQDVKTYLQSIVDEALGGNVGKAFVSSASFMGAKVTGPSKDFGRNY